MTAPNKQGEYWEERCKTAERLLDYLCPGVPRGSISAYNDWKALKINRHTFSRETPKQSLSPETEKK